LGLYDLQYDLWQTFTDTEKKTLTDSLKVVGARAKVLKAQIDQEVIRLKGIKCNNLCSQSIIAGLKDLSVIIGKIDAGVSSTSENRANNEALFSRLRRTLFLRDSSPSQWTLAHELVHADLYLFTGGIFSPLAHEGAAYGYEVLARDVLSALVTSIEPLASDLSCNQKKMTTAWHGFWSKYNRPEGMGGPIVARMSFTYGSSDFERVRTVTKLGLSCKTVAAEVNKLLERSGCCHRVSCQGSSNSSFEIGAGVAIAPVFQ
jgi:hypothetical protein